MLKTILEIGLTIFIIGLLAQAFLSVIILIASAIWMSTESLRNKHR